MRKKRFFRLFGENLVNSPSFPQVLTFTKFSPGWGNSPGFHQVLEITRCSPSFGKFTRPFTRFWTCPDFHQVLEIHQIKPNFTVKRINFTKRKGKNTSFVFLVKIWWLHRVFPKEIHQGVLQVCSRFWNFTKFSPGFHTFHQPFAINQEVSEPHQVCTAVMVCNFESSISSAPFEGEKTHEAFCTLSRTHRTLLWNETLVDPWQTLGSQLHICGGSNLSNLREFHHYVKFKT